MSKYNKNKEIRKSDVLRLAWKIMRASKTRINYTILAMILGVAFIVFLVSIGYGSQNLVISQVASFESLKTFDISSGDPKTLKINDETIEHFSEIKNIKSVQPLISLGGRASFQNSNFDVGIFGTTTRYLDLMDSNLIYGHFYQSNQIKEEIKSNTSSINETSYSQEKISEPNFNQIIKEDVKFNIQDQWVKVRSQPSLKAEVLGWAKAQKTWITGKEVFGQSYLSKENFGKFAKDKGTGEYLGKWIFAQVPLWQNIETSPEPIIENGKQKEVYGYFGENGIKFFDSGNVKLEIIPTSELENQKSSQNILKDIVVNIAVVKMMGFDNPKDVLGKTLDLDIFLTKLSTEKDNKEIKEKDFKIVGVIEGEDFPQIYLPFMTLKSFGVNNFSQVKAEVESEDLLASARQSVEHLGYQTTSVYDTVARLEEIFKWVNIGLFVFGLIAFLIALLGMFNTLTVSLLERTKEIGIMKSLGMKSKEVKLLFFLQAGMIGFLGGFGGVVIGTFLGKIFDIFLNIFFVAPSYGFVTISLVPFTFALGIILLVILVSLLTGIYPARRAAKISPLQAIRYE